jgi:hypothetical protein
MHPVQKTLVRDFTNTMDEVTRAVKGYPLITGERPRSIVKGCACKAATVLCGGYVIIRKGE